VKLLQANNAVGEPEGGDKVSAARVISEVTIVGEEEGKLIFPPGGSFIITLSTTEISDQSGEGRVAFGWWEEKINC
jgi:hypothetical protein